MTVSWPRTSFHYRHFKSHLRLILRPPCFQTRVSDAFISDPSRVKCPLYRTLERIHHGKPGTTKKTSTQHANGSQTSTKVTKPQFQHPWLRRHFLDHLDRGARKSTSAFPQVNCFLARWLTSAQDQFQSYNRLAHELSSTPCSQSTHNRAAGMQVLCTIVGLHHDPVRHASEPAR